MDLRDIFAAHAMQGILAGRPDIDLGPVASLAYIIADNMMHQRIVPSEDED